MDIWECALGFMDSQVLLTAEELDIFTFLDERPRSTAEIADKVQLPKSSLQRMLNLLCARDIIKRREDGSYVNSKDASKKLVKGKPDYVGGMFYHLREELYPLWHYFRETIQEGTSQKERLHEFWQKGNRSTEANQENDPQSVRAFMDGMHAITYRAASEFAAQTPELRDIRHIVDIGGASGAFLIALAENAPQLQGTVLDLPYVRPVSEDYIRKNNLEGRLHFKCGDFFKDPVPVDADAYSLGFILHDWDTTGGSHILHKIAEAAQEGDMLILSEYLLYDNKTGPLHVVRSDLNMMVAARGMERSAHDYDTWIRDFGFRTERIVYSSDLRGFIIARKQ
jgi:3-hydroxy-5-methyl-1-naphthoate 3-O-methyltransferase